MSLSGSMTMSSKPTGYVENYFSLDDILATQERIPCKFEAAVHNLGKKASRWRCYLRL